MKKIILLLIFLLTTLGSMIKAYENPTSKLTDYCGKYTFIDVENETTEIVSVELHSDSTLKAVANAGVVTLIYLKNDEFKLSEYEGRVKFIRDESKLNVIAVKVTVPIANIDTEGKKDQLNAIK